MAVPFERIATKIQASGTVTIGMCTARGPEMAEVEGFELHVIMYEHDLCVPEVAVDP